MAGLSQEPALTGSWRGVDCNLMCRFKYKTNNKSKQLGSEKGSEWLKVT